MEDKTYCSKEINQDGKSYYYKVYNNKGIKEEISVTNNENRDILDIVYDPEKREISSFRFAEHSSEKRNTISFNKEGEGKLIGDYLLKTDIEFDEKDLEGMLYSAKKKFLRMKKEIKMVENKSLLDPYDIIEYIENF